MAKKSYTHYAVRKGRNIGVFTSWADCRASVEGVANDYKGFFCREEAEAYLMGGDSLPATVEVVARPRLGERSRQLKESKSAPLVVYTDGAHKDGVIAWAFVAMRGVITEQEESGVLDPETTPAEVLAQDNVAGEMAAAMRAVVWARRVGETITIAHDQTGVAGWAQGWKTNTTPTAKYAAFMKKAMADGVVVGFEKVKAHSGVPGNERADALCSAELNTSNNNNNNNNKPLEERIRRFCDGRSMTLAIQPIQGGYKFGFMVDDSLAHFAAYHKSGKLVAQGKNLPHILIQAMWAAC